MSRPATPGLVADVTVAGRLRASLRAEPGEVVAVIGPNGAGKSTLLGALAGLVPAAGTVTVAGRTWSGPGVRPALVRERGVGYVVQGQALFPHLTARANAAFGLRARGVRRDEAHAAAQGWLDRLGVGDLAHRRPRQLSGGQAQRVALARALATDPALLLLDEPFAGLDVGVATALRLEIGQHLRAYAGIALLVTHDALDALTLADRVLVLDGGRVAQTGTPAEVAARPLTDHVARLVGLDVVRDGHELVAFDPSAVTVHPADPPSPPPPSSARLRWRGTVADVTPRGAALRLLVRCPGGGGGPDGPAAETQLIADVTPAAAADLGLVPGREVWLTVKETATRRYPAPAGAGDG